MTHPVFSVPDGDTLPIFFASFDGGTGASSAMTALATTDIEIYKDGVATTRSSDSGYTLLDTDGLDFAGHTGINGVSLDLSDNTDVGFYAVGSWFTVIVDAVTVDSQTVRFVAAQFRIMAAEASAGVVDANVASMDAATVTAAAIATDAVDADALAADAVTEIVAGMNDISEAEVNAQVDLALSDINLDHLLAVADADNVVDNSVIAHIVSATGDWSTFDDANESLEALRARGDAAWVTATNAAIAAAVWDTARSSHVTAGSFGQIGELIVTNGVVETSGSNSATQVQTDLAEATNDHYDVMTILFTSGAEAGQSRLITGYVGSTGVVSWNADLTGTPADDVTFVILAAGTTADAVWDEILTGASHNIATSAGRRLRELEESFVQASGTIATVTDGHTVTLDAGAVATADYYPHSRLTITEGTGAGQSRLIINYTVGRVCTLESDFTTNPDTASLYSVEAADANSASEGRDQAVGYVATYTNTTTITLDAFAVANADYYVGSLIVFGHGTGAGQARLITAYSVGRVVTMSPALDTALAAGTTYAIKAVNSIAETVDQVLDEALSGHTTAGSLGKAIADIESDVTLILADTNELQSDDVPALIAALNDLSAANVNAEMVDVMATDTHAQLAGVLSGSPTYEQVLVWLGMLSRNKLTQTATTLTLRNDADDGDVAASTVSDAGGTATRGEFA